MGRRCVIAALLPLCACGAQLGDDGATGDARSNTSDGHLNQTVDARSDGTVPLGNWSTPQKVPGADTTVDEDDVTLSRNELELYFKKSNGTDNDLYVMTRATTTAAWSSPAPVTALNSGSGEESPRLADNDLTMYFGRGGDIYKGTRATTGTQTWTNVGPVTTLNTGANEKWAAVCDGGYVIVSRANGTAGQDLYDGNVATGATNLLTQLNTNSNEQGTFLTTDCLGLYFQSNRTNNLYDIYMSTRTTTTSAWSNPTKLTDFNTATYGEEDAWIAASQRTFAFANDASGSKDVYISTR